MLSKYSAHKHINKPMPLLAVLYIFFCCVCSLLFDHRRLPVVSALSMCRVCVCVRKCTALRVVCCYCLSLNGSSVLMLLCTVRVLHNLYMLMIIGVAQQKRKIKNLWQGRGERAGRNCLCVIPWTLSHTYTDVVVVRQDQFKCLRALFICYTFCI